MTFFPQVKVCKQDILDATAQLKTSSKNKLWSALFTKDFTLKKPVGKAEKSWTLVSVKGSIATSPEVKSAEAKTSFLKLLSSTKGRDKITFRFERQNLFIDLDRADFV